MRHLARLLCFNNVTLGVLLTVSVMLLWWAEQRFQPAFLAPLRQVERLAYDWRFRIRGPQVPGDEVVIAAIDEKSLDKLGRWPWPYTKQAQLVRRLTAYDAAAIGYDVVFSSSDTSGGFETLQTLQTALAAQDYAGNPALRQWLERALAAADHDRLFAEALQESKRTILGYFFHWSCQDVAHLQSADLARHVHHLALSNNAGYIPRVAPGASFSAGAFVAACAVESNLPILSKTVWGNGFFNSRPDADDGVIRHYPLMAQYGKSLAGSPESHESTSSPVRQYDLFAPLGMRVLERYLQQRDGHANTIVALREDGKAQIWLVTGQQRYEIPMNQAGQLVLNHLGPSELLAHESHVGRRYRFPRYSVADILEGNTAAAPPEAFRGKMVIVGATATGLPDLRITPFDAAMPGLETHATAIDNILRRHFLTEPWWAALGTALNILLVGFCLTGMISRLGALHGNLVSAALVAGNVGLNYYLFTQGWLLNIVYPLCGTVVVWVGMTLYHYAVERRQSRYLHKTFSTYLSPELVSEMVRQRIPPQLGGSSGIRTAFFTDIQSFSRFSEILTAEQLVAWLNEYLTAMTDILLAEGGTLDKYEGDAIVAFFGAPIEQPDHAARALRVALRMQQSLHDLRQKWRLEGDKWPALVHDMRMRIGMSSGEIQTGNMGSTVRMNYTMMGDVVNTAARLEASCKHYGIYIQCTRQSLELAGWDDFEWRRIDTVKVVGKTEAVETFEILALPGQLSQELRAMRELYHQGLALYHQRQWDEALARFAESEKREEVFPERPTTPSRVYMERCALLKASPPAANWDGTWALTSK